MDKLGKIAGIHLAIAFAVAALVGLGACGDSKSSPAGATTSSSSSTAEEEGGRRAKGEEGCPCGCDHSEEMTAELRARGGEAALQTIDDTLGIIAEREDAGYITEAQIEHRLRLLELQRELGGSSLRASAGRLLPRTIVGEATREALAPVADATLRVRTDLYVHGQSTEIVHGREKVLRASFRLWLQVENLGTTAITLAVPTLSASVPFPVSRWYLAGQDGRPWDGVVAAGETKTVHVIGYPGEPVEPGTELAAVVRVGSLVIDARARARRHWNEPS